MQDVRRKRHWTGAAEPEAALLPTGVRTATSQTRGPGSGHPPLWEVQGVC